MMRKTEPIIVYNPMVYSEMKKYIYIDGNSEEQKLAAAYLFGEFLDLNIYVDGFVTDCEFFIGCKMYNKPIINISELESDRDIAFVQKKHADIRYENVQPLQMLNPSFTADEVVIYGAGFNGEWIKKELEACEIKIICFIDSNPDIVGEYRQGLEVCSSDILRELPENIAVIEASNKHREIDKIVKHINAFAPVFYYEHHRPLNYNLVLWDKRDVNFRLYNIRMMATVLEGKRVYVYGTDENAREYAAKMRLLDFDFRGFLCDYEDLEAPLLDGFPVQCAEEIIYETGYYICVSNIKKDIYIDKLDKLGLQYFRDFTTIDQTMNTLWYIRRNCLDINLGYTYCGNHKVPGIMMYGNEHNSEYKIAVLGGSTTDGNLYPFKSWPEFLYEKWNSPALTVYNAGVAGYNSGQELIKLIRDIINLNPDMIIVYDGYNDTMVKSGDLFAFQYSKEIYEFAHRNIEEAWMLQMRSYGNDTVDKMRDIKICVDTWLQNITLMKAIADAKGIQFYAFVQPMLDSKNNRDKKEESLLLSGVDLVEQNAAIASAFRKEVADRELEKEYSYIYDLSDIFDNVYNVYLDEIHVNEKGNSIIADKIFEIVR
ncbi:MAG: hypothetical protein K2O65_09250 [Lachnospiraceae bacterium]|nr:hypothetical protein [Lachnospiraceae bacterium]